VCDLSYAIQREEIVARALAEMQLAPHVEDSTKIAPPHVAVDEFDQWLNDPPPEVNRSGDPGLEELIAGGRR
jgi:hypothetical protein